MFSLNTLEISNITNRFYQFVIKEVDEGGSAECFTEGRKPGNLLLRNKSSTMRKWWKVPSTSRNCRSTSAISVASEASKHSLNIANAISNSTEKGNSDVRRSQTNINCESNKN